MKSLTFIIAVLFQTLMLNDTLAKNETSKSSKSHEEHQDVEKNHEHEEDDHGKEHDGENHHDEGEHSEESNPKVGADKGILEASKEKGFKISPEAYKNFEIKTIKLENTGPWILPLKARMLSQEEVNLYRLREGFIKRIDFSLVSKAGSNMNILSKELKSGDEVIIHGIGFVRIAELAAYGGAPEGHSH